jgi:caffeoyl-CoA O-methyltransferase
MAEKNRSVTEALYQYAIAHGHNRDPLLLELEAETASLGPIARMQISREQGTLLSILTRAINARSAVEVGTFTGYSSIVIARALPPDGRLLCCDVSEEYTAIARRFWNKAGVSDKITLKIGPGLATLSSLPIDYSIDIGFIDADKPNYTAYYEEILKRTRPDGLILIDNVLWSGRVIDDSDGSEDTIAIRALNDLIANDNRVEAVMLPIADGLTIARKK